MLMVAKIISKYKALREFVEELSPKAIVGYKKLNKLPFKVEKSVIISVIPVEWNKVTIIAYTTDEMLLIYYKTLIVSNDLKRSLERINKEVQKFKEFLKSHDYEILNMS